MVYRNPLERLKRLKQRVDDLNKGVNRLKGEGPGHPFRGNQYTGSGGGPGNDDMWTPAQNRVGEVLEQEYKARFTGPTGGGGDPEDALNYEIGGVQIKILPDGTWHGRGGAVLGSGKGTTGLRRYIERWR